MILGSHNSWSYLPVIKWWMKPIAFMARCQNVDIRTQYNKYGVRCFDLRVRYDGICMVLGMKYVNTRVAHGIVEYDIDVKSLCRDLEWLDKKGDCYVRVIHEVRNEKQKEQSDKGIFQTDCYHMFEKYPHIKFWCGRNLYNWQKDYDFGDDPKCDEKYGSVSGKKWLYGWWPLLYARLHNRKNLKEGNEGILLIDYVNIR